MRVPILVRITARLISTRTISALVNHGKIGDDEVLSPSVVAVRGKANALIPALDGFEYGYGTIIDAARGVRVLRDDRGDPGDQMQGYASAVRMPPDLKTGVAVFVNLDTANPTVVADAVQQRLLPVGFGPPPPRAPIASTNPSANAGEHMNGPMNGPVNGMARLSASRSEGTLQVKTPNMIGEPLTLEPIGSDCFRGKTVTVCFTGDFAFWNGKAYRQQ